MQRASRSIDLSVFSFSPPPFPQLSHERESVPHRGTQRITALVPSKPGFLSPHDTSSSHSLHYLNLQSSNQPPPAPPPPHPPLLSSPPCSHLSASPHPIPIPCAVAGFHDTNNPKKSRTFSIFFPSFFFFLCKKKRKKKSTHTHSQRSQGENALPQPFRQNPIRPCRYPHHLSHPSPPSSPLFLFLPSLVLLPFSNPSSAFPPVPHTRSEDGMHQQRFKNSGGGETGGKRLARGEGGGGKEREGMGEGDREERVSAGAGVETTTTLYLITPFVLVNEPLSFFFAIKIENCTNSNPDCRISPSPPPTRPPPLFLFHSSFTFFFLTKPGQSFS
eukprot:Rhum_TRINITY_DN10946_c1_g1::Rhum_TRINITY_DN10946_c1_g1_i1::g.41503::m.41503